MEMLMSSAPHYQPLVWASLEVIFPLSLLFFPLSFFSGPVVLCAVYLRVCCLVSGCSSLAEVFHILTTHPPEHCYLVKSCPLQSKR